MKSRNLSTIMSRAGRGRRGAASQGGGCLGCGGAAVLLLFMGFCASLTDSGSSPSASRYDAGLSTSSYTPSYPAPQARETFYIHGPLNVRSGAGKSFDVVRTLSRGERVQLGPKDSSGWAPMYDNYGSAIGYVYRASDNVRSYAPTALPARTRQRSHPAGASALCRDGTYSYSASRRGACSWHGGVAQWL